MIRKLIAETVCVKALYIKIRPLFFQHSIIFTEHFSTRNLEIYKFLSTLELAGCVDSDVASSNAATNALLTALQELARKISHQVAPTW